MWFNFDNGAGVGSGKYLSLPACVTDRRRRDAAPAGLRARLQATGRQDAAPAGLCEAAGRTAAGRAPGRAARGTADSAGRGGLDGGAAAGRC